MNDSDDSAFTLVYEGYDPLQAGLLARLLEAEGIVCRQLGTQHPAALGIGEYACVQRLEVPPSDAVRARDLIAETLGSSASEADEAASD